MEKEKFIEKFQKEYQKKFGEMCVVEKPSDRTVVIECPRISVILNETLSTISIEGKFHPSQSDLDFSHSFFSLIFSSPLEKPKEEKLFEIYKTMKEKGYNCHLDFLSSNIPEQFLECTNKNLEIRFLPSSAYITGIVFTEKWERKLPHPDELKEVKDLLTETLGSYELEGRGSITLYQTKIKNLDSFIEKIINLASHELHL